MNFIESSYYVQIIGQGDIPSSVNKANLCFKRLKMFSQMIQTLREANINKARRIMLESKLKEADAMYQPSHQSGEGVKMGLAFRFMDSIKDELNK